MKRIRIPLVANLPEGEAAALVALGEGTPRALDTNGALALHELLGEILGARPISPELAASLWTMYQAAQGSAGHTAREAFIDVLTNGLKYSSRGLPEDVKEPAPPAPAITAAEADRLRSIADWLSADASSLPATSRRVFERRATFLEELATRLSTAPPTAEELLERVPVLRDRGVSEMFDGMEAGLGRKPEPAPPALSVQEIDALRACVSCARALAGGKVETEKERLLNLATVAVAAVDRLSGAAGPHEKDDAFDARQAELARQAARFITALQGGDAPAAKALESVGVPLIPAVYEGVMRVIATWAEDLNQGEGPPEAAEAGEAADTARIAQLLEQDLGPTGTDYVMYTRELVEHHLARVSLAEGRLTALESQMAELRDAEVVAVVGRLDRTWQALGKRIRALELHLQGPHT